MQGGEDPVHRLWKTRGGGTEKNGEQMMNVRRGERAAVNREFSEGIERKETRWGLRVGPRQHCPSLSETQRNPRRGKRAVE